MILPALILLAGILPMHAQAQTSAETGSGDLLKPLRSDVGIIGVTANIRELGRFTYLGTDTLLSDTNSELEFEFRNVRMASPRIGVGFQVLTSFFAGDGDFGIGSWGLGPVIRGYPLKTEQWQPYVQADALFGNNLALGELADKRNGGDGFRMRLGLRGGVAYRVSNTIGFFLEAGTDWESSTFFKSDARMLQVNFGIDLYRFN